LTRATDRARGLLRRLGLRQASGRPDGAAFDWVRPHFVSPPAALAPFSPGALDRPLHFAWLVPPFRIGSGGHMTIFTLADELERSGHTCSIWIDDPERTMWGGLAVARRQINEHFVPLQAEVFDGFDRWRGADVAFATGWQTAYPLRGLTGCMLKAYLVQDFEPDFYPASAPRLWAEETYRMDYLCVTASPWLSHVLREDYGAATETFELGVDHDLYRPLGVPRRDDTVIFYARPSTPRRATELGILALEELVRRRPAVRAVFFGDTGSLRIPFAHESLGLIDPPALARLYNEATVGLVISLSNYSRMPKEMMACGLPVVDVRHPSVVSAFEPGGDVIALAGMDLVSIADRLESLIEDPARREALARRASAFVAPMSWHAAAGQIEAAVRRGLEARSGAQPPAGRRSPSR
jgi:glycosyltransferase involved in cell wall biosynthesis